MIQMIIGLALAFLWLGYESDWMRVRLMIGLSLRDEWMRQFHIYGEWFNKVHDDYYSDNWCRIPHYNIELSPGVHDTLCGGKWLEKHWHDLDNYAPKVELYFGNGYRQTFTLRKPELIRKIIQINTGKKYFRRLATA